MYLFKKQTWLTAGMLLTLTACGGGGGGGGGGGTGTGTGTDTGTGTGTDTALSVSLTPGDGASNVDRTGSIAATFNRDMLATSIDDTSFTLSSVTAGNVNASVSFDATTNVATLTPVSKLGMNQSHSVSLSTAITDLSGNALTATNSNFTSADGAWGVGRGLVNRDKGYANPPQVTMDGNGNAIAVWSQAYNGTPEKIHSNIYTAGLGWSQLATNVESINYRGSTDYSGDPQIATDGNGNAMMVWDRNTGSRSATTIRAKLYTAGVGWIGTSLATAIQTHNRPGKEPQIAMNSSSNAMAVYITADFNASNGNAIEASVHAVPYTTGVGWGADTLISAFQGTMQNQSRSAQIAIDNSGNAIAVWKQQATNASHFIVYANRYTAGTGWGTAIPIEPDTAVNSDSPRIAMDSSGNAVVVWRQVVSNTNYTSDTFNYATRANRYTIGAGWGTAESIEIDLAGSTNLVENSGIPDIAMDNSGTALVLWAHESGDHAPLTNSNFIYARSYTASGWGAVQVLETDNASPNSIPKVAMDGSGNAVARWTKYYPPFTSPNQPHSNRYVAGVGWGTTGVTPYLIDTYGWAPKYDTHQVAMDATGTAVMVWMGPGADTNLTGTHQVLAHQFN
jgi:hypothetical protein